MSYNLGFIGGGNMSTAIVQGILKNEALPVSKIWVSGPHPENLKYWSDIGTNVTSKNGEVMSNCDIIFLGVKPGLLHTVVESISQYEFTRKPVLVLSMLAGISINDLHLEFQVLSDKIKVIRVMPNTPMAVGAGSCLYSPDNNVLPEECELIEKLLSGCGICERVPEELINSLGCLTACGPAFVYVIIDALADGAVKQGVPRAVALRHAAQMVMGSAKLVLQSDKHPAVLKDEVCSPGGSTICGINALENGNIRATLINAIEASRLRTKEMGTKQNK